SSPKASAASLPPRLLRLLPAGATVAGRVFHPQGVRAFARRTWRSLKSTDQLAALELLDHLGWIHPSDALYFRGAQFVRGTTWTVNPAVHTRFTQRAEAARRMAAEAKRRLIEAVSKEEKL
ncbi:MAG: hypothetical protein ACREUG_01205, partial [Steroidobacteraceae bacterium]